MSDIPDFGDIDEQSQLESSQRSVSQRKYVAYLKDNAYGVNTDYVTIPTTADCDTYFWMYNIEDSLFNIFIVDTLAAHAIIG